MALLKIESSQENDLIYNHYLATPGERSTKRHCLNNEFFLSSPFDKPIKGITQDIYWTSGRYSRDGSKEWATNPPYELFNYTNWSPTSSSGPQPDFCLPNGNDCNPAYAE